MLRHGRASRYARYFDIDWEPDDPQLRGKVAAADPRPAVRRGAGRRRNSVRGDNAGNAFIQYFDHNFPLAAGALHSRRAGFVCRIRSGLVGRTQRLHGLLEGQHYRLAGGAPPSDASTGGASSTSTSSSACAWRTTRRSRPSTPRSLRLYAEGLIDGVRVDHVDGLADPAGYCRKLRRLRALDRERPSLRAGRLSRGREDPAARRDPAADWGCDGTTGYDFMDEVSALQHDAAGERRWPSPGQRSAAGRPISRPRRRRRAARSSRAASRPSSRPVVRASIDRAGDLTARPRPAGPAPRADRDAGAFSGLSRAMPASRTPRRRPPFLAQAADAREDDLPAERPLADRILAVALAARIRAEPMRSSNRLRASSN